METDVIALRWLRREWVRMYMIGVSWLRKEGVNMKIKTGLLMCRIR